MWQCLNSLANSLIVFLYLSVFFSATSAKGGDDPTTSILSTIVWIDEDHSILSWWPLSLTNITLPLFLISWMSSIFLSAFFLAANARVLFWRYCDTSLIGQFRKEGLLAPQLWQRHSPLVIFIISVGTINIILIFPTNPNLSQYEQVEICQQIDMGKKFKLLDQLGEMMTLSTFQRDLWFLFVW